MHNVWQMLTVSSFTALELRPGAEWSQLSMGIPVTGGVCVKSTAQDGSDAAALFIVGGTPSNSSAAVEYEGFQRFTFADGKWENLSPTVPVTKGRLYHGAVYLNTSDSILVYAGTQDGSMQPSSQTFTIQTSEPYTVLAFQSVAPPAVNPLLMQWTESQALYIGGSDVNTRAFVFDPSESWFDSGASLGAPLHNSSVIKSIIIDGDDASKTLYTFDMTIAPNEVNRTILVDGSGNPVPSSKPVVSRGLKMSGLLSNDERSSQRVRRDNLTVADWPAYNDTLAPSSTRTSYSIAQDPSGLVVISGGNDEDVLCMFQARENCWANATAALVSKSSTQQGLGPASTATATTSMAPSIASQATSSTASSTNNAASPAFPVKILVAVLGTIIGVALILLVTLILLRWRRKRKQYSDAGHQRRSSGIPSEKDSHEFSGLGLAQMTSTRQFQGHEPQTSQGSFSSMAILMGRVGGHRRGGEKDGSDSSSQFNKKYKTAISNPIPQEQPFSGFKPPEKISPLTEERGAVPRPRGSRGGRRGSTRRSSGWNRYWSGGSAMNILGFGSKRTTYEDSDGDSESRYSHDQRLPSQATQTSAMVLPLKLSTQPELSRVASASPKIAYTSSKFPLTREMSGQIERPGSMNSMSSYDDDDRRDAFSSGVPASVHEQSSWTPVERQDWATRTQSDAYSETVYTTTLPRSTAADFPRDTQFPSPPSHKHPPQPSTDMSWLNLGGESKK